MSQEQLDAVMQAAERLDALFDSTFVDFENMPVECIRDLFEMAKSYRRILPKGERPVAMTQPGPTVGHGRTGESWGLDLDDGEVFSTECRCAGCWSGVYRVAFYTTEADARLALHWQLFDRLAAASR